MAIVLILFSILPFRCDYGRLWEDSPYIVIWMDVSSNRKLTIDLGDGGSIGRVQAEVIAVGSNEHYIVAKRKDPSSGKIQYYYIDRDKDHPFYNGEEITQGPFNKVEFKKIKKKLSLPKFSKRF